MNKTLVALLAFTTLVTYVYSFCFSLGPYHLSAAAFAQGLGDINSSSVCVYGNTSVSNSSCPLACESLIVATWGDCYCKDRFYRPNTSNALVRTLTVYEMYELLATPKYFRSANCRDFLNRQDSLESWKCL
eukprot:TRINITY_DN1713_c0_g1_i1.p1 TRINITY_DN1713_c0_g1~~TRINITY_DN1713_c0_g1_i1.p1  ORF type:complete len:139 (+),score=15.30 TRINITY_DN1713_c0_g1_i1:26-418(+)